MCDPSLPGTHGSLVYRYEASGAAVAEASRTDAQVLALGDADMVALLRDCRLADETVRRGGLKWPPAGPLMPRRSPFPVQIRHFVVEGLTLNLLQRHVSKV